MIQNLITSIIVLVSVVIALIYIYRIFYNKKDSGCSACSASACSLRDNIKKEQKVKSCNIESGERNG